MLDSGRGFEIDVRDIAVEEEATCVCRILQDRDDIAFTCPYGVEK